VKALVAILVASFVLAPTASATFDGGPMPFHATTQAPTGLRAFLLTPDESTQAYYPRTPSFAWNPVSAKGGTYDFELSMSRSFDESEVIFTESTSVPAATIKFQLPWMTGVPYALWAHVRWESANKKTVTAWSQPFGFNMRWTDDDYPQQLPAPEGLIRWKPIEGATGYEVLFPDLNGAHSFVTTTNVADEREFFTFHNQFGYGATIHWRVRAIRYINPAETLSNQLPTASFGPWSQTFTTVNPPLSLGVLKPTDTVSDTWDKAGGTPTAHDLMPGFAWTASAPVTSPYIGAFGSSLYRVYIFTDDHCVNQVFAGSIVGSPAYAPRSVGGPLQLPADTGALGFADGLPYTYGYGGQGDTVDATGDTVKPTDDAGSTTSTAKVDLWDSGWPNGRYYWTVVPVSVQLKGVVNSTSNGGQVEYHDMAVPQDECEAGYGMSFGKTTQPVVTKAGTPWVSGVSADGRLVASASKLPTVHDSPLIAWEPATGAESYDIELSRQRYPWKPAKTYTTDGTSYLLPLGKSDTGSWWYRVRGVDSALPAAAQNMAWSIPVHIKVTGDSFVVVK
jgi:hypothetical protein